MAASRGIILNGLTAIHRTVLGANVFGNNNAGGFLSQVRQYAARRGTREKARKKKVKKEVKKLTLADKIQRSKKTVTVKPFAIMCQDNHLPEATDDVYMSRFFKHRIYSFEEAIKCHREVFHPTMYNSPKSLVELFVELNFEGVKKTKPVETFRKMVPVTHKFDHGEERKILVFCKTEEQTAEALSAGASLAGGSEVIKLILNGEILISNYDTVLAHPAMLPEVLTIRGLLKKKHPNMKSGTLSPDIKHMVYSHLHGIKYVAQAFSQYPTYGEATVPIGTLDMDIKNLEQNLQDTVNSIMSAKPKRPGSFITRLFVQCPNLFEKLKIDHSLYIKEEGAPDSENVENEEDDNAAVAIPI